MPKNSTKTCPVIFDGEVETGQTAVLDFTGLKKVDQASIMEALLVKTPGLKFRKVYEKGRQIVLEYTWTNPLTVMSYLRELLSSFGYAPVQVATA